jgi:hypothetical protein
MAELDIPEAGLQVHLKGYVYQSVSDGFPTR